MIFLKRELKTSMRDQNQDLKSILHHNSRLQYIINRLIKIRKTGSLHILFKKLSKLGKLVFEALELISFQILARAKDPFFSNCCQIPFWVEMLFYIAALIPFRHNNVAS